jgi:hypothetical protein
MYEDHITFNYAVFNPKTKKLHNEYTYEEDALDYVTHHPSCTYMSITDPEYLKLKDQLCTFS